MHEKVPTHELWLRLARARADGALQRAAGDLEGLQVSRFVATTLVMRLAHRLHQGARQPHADPQTTG